MLKRKIVDDMKYWKDNRRNTCLVITGARQVGKTYIIREFAKNNYEKFYELNFLENKELNGVFVDNLSVQSILMKLSLIINDFNLVDGKTLIFLDEIQMCPEAITALKFLAQDSRFDCIASGSMLGIAYNRASSFPVGYVERINMNSLDFEEFLWARGINEDTINYVKDFYLNKTTVDELTHKRMLELFKEYIVVGGMPDVVNEFILNNNFSNVLKIQRRIVNDYKDDIVKYASVNDKAKIRKCFDSIPSQLAKENKKFQYKLVENNSNKSKYFDSLEWLYDAGIINFCYNLRTPNSPLEGNKIDDSFKVYMRDTGLLVSMLDDDTNYQISNGNLGIYNGAIYENIISDIFNKSGKKLYYFEKNSTLEVDFIIKYNSMVTAVEVKSGDNTKSKSLNSIMNNYGVPYGIKLSSKNLGIKDNLLILPIYMSMFL